MFFMWIFLLAIDLGLCYLVGLYADEKGYSMGLWFFLAFLTTPLIAFIILLIMGDSVGSRQYYPSDDYSNNHSTSRNSYSKTISTINPKIEKKDEVNKLSGKEFFERISRDHKLYKNEIITLDKKENNYSDTIKNLRNSHLEGDYEGFMHEIIDLLDEEILNKEQFENIKNLVLNKYKLQKLKTSDLALKYKETGDELIKDELNIRGISLEAIENDTKLLDYSHYELISKYIETKDDGIKEILNSRGLYDENHISNIRGIKGMTKGQLINRYLEEDSNNNLYKEELKYRKISTSIEELISEIDNFDLINLYRLTGSDLAKKELIKRDLHDFAR